MRFTPNLAFILGIAFNSALFSALNIHSFLYPKVEEFNPFSGGDWEAGFPFSMFFAYMGNPNSYGFVSVRVLLNLVVYGASSIVIGYGCRLLARRQLKIEKELR